ncbi:phage tail protein [Victivallis vadensis]|uniref:phage tail-collar fiber domain-containing protein n=1 Tax=Victivallis vadensis TaxID=172901 RepID=UPI0023F704B5|nr:phage tail protein [Victivallis vadensis]
MPNSIITDAGRALLVRALKEGLTVTIDRMIFADVPGLDPAVTPGGAQPMPPADQIKMNAAIDHAGIDDKNPDTIIYSKILTATDGNWYLNWIGLYSSQHETLIAVCVVPRHYKFKTDGFQAGNTLYKNFAIQYANASTLTGITIPAEKWQYNFDDRYAFKGHDHAGKYEPLGAVNTHNSAADPHPGKFDAAGTATAAVNTHNSAASPHPGKFEAAGAVNTHNSAADPHPGKFDAAGTATAAVNTHNSAASPHPGKFEAAGAVAAHNSAAAPHPGKFDAAGAATSAVNTHNSAASPHPGKFEAAGAVAAHNSAADAHPDLRGRLDAIADHVVEVWTAADGSAWYRKYSSGWVEQGGTLPTGTTIVLTVTFPIQFANADYTILKSFSIHNDGEGGGGSIIYNQAGFYTKTATSARTSMTNLMDAAFWIAFGRAAQQGGSDGGSGGTQ